MIQGHGRTAEDGILLDIKSCLTLLKNYLNNVELFIFTDIGDSALFLFNHKCSFHLGH